MPIELFDLAKLIGGIILFIIPGYLYSFLILHQKDITRLERIVFGFILTLSMFILTFFTLDLVLKIPVTQLKTMIIYIVYTATILFLYAYSIKKKGIPTNTKQFITKTKDIIRNPKQAIKNNQTVQILLLLTAILIFAAFMGFIPHLKENYYLPFHVDEWIHWTFSKSFMETGFTAFTNPWLGTGISRSLEPGFVYIIGSLSWLTGVHFNTMFIFMPAIITLFASLAAFNLGNRHERPFGLEAALAIAVIPTTCRMMGPSFFVPVGTGLFFLIFLVWFHQIKKTDLSALFVPLGLWVIFLIHPPTALAGIIITIIYAAMLLFDKQFKLSALNLIYSLLPIGAAFLLSSRWNYSLQQVIDAFFGGKYFSEYDLPQIWVSFEEMGFVIWILAVIGVYFAFSKGKTIIRTIGISALAFIIIIGLYDKMGYGLPIMYERSFMYLFLMIALVAGWGLAELRRSITEVSLDYLPVKNGKVKLNASIKKMSVIIPFIIFFILIGTTVPAHMDIPYYHMIDETDYETCIWIEKNIDQYQPGTKTLKAAVDPYKASPFSAITRLYIVSSTMHPIPGYEHHQKVTNFLSGCCKDTSFLETFSASVVYTTGCCNNQNLTMINPNVYILE
jgi:hypothetical protein